MLFGCVYFFALFGGQSRFGISKAKRYGVFSAPRASRFGISKKQSQAAKSMAMHGQSKKLKPHFLYGVHPGGLLFKEHEKSGRVLNSSAFFVSRQAQAMRLHKQY